MNDLWMAALVVTVFTVSSFLVGLQIGTSKSSRFKHTILAVTLGLIIAVVFFGRNSTWFIRAFPLQAGVIYENTLPLLAGLLAGLTWRNLSANTLRRALMAAGLVALSFQPILHVLIIRTPQCGNLWKGEICRQTTDYTCGPAAAATLLRHHRIFVTEQEMAKLCCTDENGTSLSGLFRGLEIKSRDHPLRVVAGHQDLDSLKAQCAWPVILIVGLDKTTAARQPRYSHDWGWVAGTQHTIVFYGFGPQDSIVVGDPSVGKERWNEQSLMDLWHGDVVYLAPKGNSVN